ncbi:hypothetical protein V2J09_007468 [Rumex salicifolius]
MPIPLPSELGIAGILVLNITDTDILSEIDQFYEMLEWKITSTSRILHYPPLSLLKREGSVQSESCYNGLSLKKSTSNKTIATFTKYSMEL